MGRYFDSTADFLAMAPYGAFVWSAYGIILAVCLVLVALVQRRFRRARAAEASRERIFGKRTDE